MMPSIASIGYGPNGVTLLKTAFAIVRQLRDWTNETSIAPWELALVPQAFGVCHALTDPLA